MTSTLWWLGLIFGTLSVVMLIKHGFDYGFVAPLQLVLDYYEQTTHALFGWAEPWIQTGLLLVGEWFGWQLSLDPGWKHMFIVLLAAFGAAIRSSPTTVDASTRSTTLAAGATLALVTAVIWSAQIGALAQMSDLDPVLLFIWMFTPLLSVVLFAAFLSSSIKQPIYWQIIQPLLLLLSGILLAFLFIGLIWNLDPRARDTAETAANPHHLTFLFGVVVAIASVVSYALVSGLKTGRAILSTYLGATIFFASNAGLKLAGL